MPIRKPVVLAARAASLLIVACSLFFTAWGAGRAEPGVEADDRAIVDDYRRIIALLADSPTADADPERASMVGRYLFFRNLERANALGARLASALSGAATSSGAPAEVTRFLDDVEDNAEYRDADKLAFKELLAQLADHLDEELPTATFNPALRRRIDDDLDALKRIQALYEKELEKVLSRLSVRGITVRRESWESYVAFVRTRFDRAAVLREFEPVRLEQPQSRAGRPAKGNRAELNGSTLPARTLVLTFDDGPHARYTDRILDILNEAKVPAVFFEVGRNIGSIEDDGTIKLTRAAKATQHILERGQALGNHSYSHPVLPSLGDAEVAKEIETASQLLEHVSHRAPVMFRAPYGARNQGILSALETHKLKSIMWNIDSEDWADPIPASIAARVLDEVEKQKRGIVLFHDIHERTVEALPLVLQGLKDAGYSFAAWDGTQFAVATGTETPRGIAAPARVAAPAPYRESWAVLIGIDDYAKWPKLRYAVNDATAIRDLLIRRYQFKPENIFLLLDREATREKILSLLGDKLADPGLVKHDDRVLVFFAGHGATRKLPSGRELGYIVPVEAAIDNFHGQAISMTNFQDISEAIPAKHVLFVMDSCYSGLALTRGARPAGGQNFLQEVSRRSARQMLTAGGADQQVADSGPNGHSVFTWTLMQALEGNGDLNGDGVITASEIAAYAGPIVSSLSQQTPAFGSLPGSEGGEFVFELRHEGEFLNDQSAELDQEAIQLNAEIARLRAEITAKAERNQKLKVELAQTQEALQRGGPAPPAKDAAAARNDRGTALFREKKYAEAAGEFKAAFELDSGSALAANNLGFAYYKLENYPEATRWFEKAIEIDPKRAIAYYNLGDAYVQSNRIDDARNAFEQFLQLQPSAKAAPQAREKLRTLGPEAVKQ
jgi:peptidoglycan/xylan/chitin deacetylase (PgdA/CDA1 family)/uncharacterized caspase-like protein